MKTKITESEMFWETLREGLVGKPTGTNAALQVFFGRVTQFNPERNFGIAVVESLKKRGLRNSFSLSTANGPFLVGSRRDSSFPVFATLVKTYPPVGAAVALELSEANGVMQVSRWCCAKAYRKVQEIIKNRPQPEQPIYRIMYRENGEEIELVRDRLDRITKAFPRGDADPLAKYLAKEIKSGGYLFWLRMEPATCEFDPKGGLVVLSDELVWTETNDPRSMPVKIEAAKPSTPVTKKSALLAPVIPVEVNAAKPSKVVVKKREALAPAMPKKQTSERQFSKTLKGFDSLVLA